MPALSLGVSGLAALTWLLPSPGERGVAGGIGMLLVLAWLSRLGLPAQRRGLAAVCAAVLGTASLTDPFALAAGVLGLVALAAAAGGMGVVALGVGAVGFVGCGRLESAALLTGLVTLARGDLRPRTSILASGAVLGLAGWLASAVAGRGIPVAPREQSSIARSALAEVLDASNVDVIARSAYAAAVGARIGSGSFALERVGDLESRSGLTATSLAVRVLACGASKGDARVHLAEAVHRVPETLDSLEAWQDASLPWKSVASCLYLGRPLLHLLELPAAADWCRDSLTAEFSARLLAKVGLEAEACSLASMTQWRDRGWARYIVWKARQPWEAPAQGMPVGRQPRAVRASKWVLAMGRPARGVWPVIRFTGDGASEEIPICAEDWILLPRRIQAQGWIILVNDLRAPGEDRNAAIEPVDDFAEEWFTTPPPDLEGFRQRVGRRLRTWGAGPVSPVSAFVTAGTGLVPMEPSSTSLAVPADGAWMLAGPGSIDWCGVPDSGVVLVARGQPATGIWPIIEIGSAGGLTRRVIDTWSWTPRSVVVSSGDSLSVRFVNDFWNPHTRQDRNLWIAGLFVDTSQARTHATH